MSLINIWIRFRMANQIIGYPLRHLFHTLLLRFRNHGDNNNNNSHARLLIGGTRLLLYYISQIIAFAHCTYTILFAKFYGLMRRTYGIHCEYKRKRCRLEAFWGWPRMEFLQIKLWQRVGFNQKRQTFKNIPF